MRLRKLSTRDPGQIKDWMEKVLFQGKELPFKITVLGPNVVFWNKEKNIGITNQKVAAQVYLDDSWLRFEGSFEGLIENIHQFKTCQGK